MFLKTMYFDSGAKSSGGREDSESSGPQRRNSSEANSGDFLDLKVSVTTWGERLGGKVCLEIRFPASCPQDLSSAPAVLHRST